MGFNPYPERRLLGFSRIDGTVWFYTRVNALLSPDAHVLNIGCGRGSAADDPVAYRRRLQSFSGRCAGVIGIDVDDVGRDNPLVDEFRLIPLSGAWPVESESVDLAICDWVVEHVTDPGKFFAECARVIKPGGFLCIRTSNRYGYAAIASRLIPDRLHGRVLERAQSARQREDVFPTMHLCNTRGTLRSRLEEAGFEAWVETYEAEPAYLDFSRHVYAIGVRATRLLPAPMRSTVHAFARHR